MARPLEDLALPSTLRDSASARTQYEAGGARLEEPVERRGGSSECL